MKKIIEEARFYDVNNDVEVNFRDLQPYTVYRVTGRCHYSDEAIDSDCTTTGCGTLLINHYVYEVIPITSKDLENAISIVIFRFVNDANCQSTKSVKTAKGWVEKGKELCADGYIKSHYRLAQGGEVKTSLIQKFFVLEDTQFFETKNSLYRIVSIE